MAYPLPEKPSIAVLPFVNNSDDAKLGFFASGLTEDLTAALGTPPIGQVPALDDEPVDLHGLARVTAALRT